MRKRADLLSKRRSNWAINFFDTANVYSDEASQEVLDRTLSQLSNSAESEKFECKENLLAKVTS